MLTVLCSILFEMKLPALSFCLLLHAAIIGHHGQSSTAVGTSVRTLPTISCPTHELEAECSANQQSIVYFDVIATDDDGSDISDLVQCNRSTGEWFRLGTSVVRCTVRNKAGLSANCSLTVHVKDSRPPFITCPTDMTLECPVSLRFTAVAIDACWSSYERSKPITVNCSPNAYRGNGITSFAVICDAVDPSGNVASCKFGLSAIDTQYPKLRVHPFRPSAVNTHSTSSSNAGAFVNFTVAADDNCAELEMVHCERSDHVATSAPNCRNELYPVGATTVCCEVCDFARLCTREWYAAVILLFLFPHRCLVCGGSFPVTVASRFDDDAAPQDVLNERDEL